MVPQSELQRLQLVQRFLQVTASREKELQDVVALAARLCNTATALISLLDKDTGHIKFKIDFELEEVPRENPFCIHTVDQDGIFIVKDAQADPRFRDHAFVTKVPHVRFYAGVPLVTSEGYRIGTLCVLDKEPHELTCLQQDTLKILARQVINTLELDLSLCLLQEQFREVKNSEMKLRSFFESSETCHLLLNTNLDILTFNKAQALFVKDVYNTVLQVGTNIAEDYGHLPHMDDFIRHARAALTGTPVYLERCLYYEKVGNIWWYISYEPAINEQGDIFGVTFNATNINERKQNEEHILAQNDLLKKIAQVQSHDIRRPVTSIMGLMELIRDEDYEHPKEYLQLMEEAVYELDEKIHFIVYESYKISAKL